MRECLEKDANVNAPHLLRAHGALDAALECGNAWCVSVCVRDVGLGYRL
jgi:hypothetical protein